MKPADPTAAPAGEAEPALDTLADLNPVQRDAVQHGEGPLLLLAGAGSGKTRVVTRRIARLLSEGAAPQSILALTFTNRAAREMRERVTAILGLDQPPPVQISTFHALGARFLRRHAEWFGRSRAFTIYDDSDQIAMIREAALRQGVELKAAEAKIVRRAFDEAKNAGHGASAAALPLDFPRTEATDKRPRLDAGRVGTDYDDLLERADAFDFGDLIVRPAEILASEPHVADIYRRRWRWLLVDEFQDTNAAQYRWLKLIAPPSAEPPGPNLFVVGDDDQSIYGWRGACVDNILQFPDEYPTARVVRLEQNYRSHRHILTAANEVIAKNRRRLGKSLWTDADDGMLLELHQAPDGRAEAHWVAGRIAHLCEREGISPGDIAVLMRANHLSLDIESGLRMMGVPHAVVRGRAFYDRAEVRDALAYVRLLVNPHDEVAFRRAVNTPSRGVGAKTLEKLSRFAADRDGSLWESTRPALAAGIVKGKALKGIRAFLAVLDRYREVLGEDGTPVDGRQPRARVRDALAEAGFLADIEVSAGAGELDAQRMENVVRLLDELGELESQPGGGTLAGFLESVKLVSEVDVAGDGLGSVSLMTVHAAKGLEFPIVFLIGVEDSIFPHRRSSADADALEEERRLFYVAITRAQFRLFVSWAEVRRSFGDARQTGRSPFIDDIPLTVYEAHLQTPRRRNRPRASFGGGGYSTGRPSARTIAAREAQERAREEALYSDPPAPDHAMGGAGQWRKGMKVYHYNYGVGTVADVGRPGSMPRLVIDFPDIGRKTISVDYVSPYEG